MRTWIRVPSATEKFDRKLLEEDTIGVYPEFCEFTDRYDHQLTAFALATQHGLNR